MTNEVEIVKDENIKKIGRLILNLFLTLKISMGVVGYIVHEYY